MFIAFILPQYSTTKQKGFFLEENGSQSPAHEFILKVD